MAHRVRELPDQLIFERKREVFIFLALLLAGLFFLLVGLLIITRDDLKEFPNTLFKFLPIGIGTSMVLGALANQFGGKMLHKIIFDRAKETITFQSNAGEAALIIPISNVAGFDIVPEKRRPSAGNSVKIHHVIYHLVIIWKSTGRWYLTETTDENEINNLLNKVKIFSSAKVESAVEVKSVLPRNISNESTKNQVILAWRSRIALVLMLALSILNFLMIGLIWWMLKHAGSIEKPVFIVIGLILFAFILLLRLIGPSIYYRARTHFQLEIDNQSLRYRQRSRIDNRVKIENSISFNDLQSISYSYSPIDLRNNSNLLIHGFQSRDNFSVQLPDLSPLECLSFELWIKENLKQLMR